MSSLLQALNVSASGLAAQRTRLNATASNVANVQSTRGPDGGPYQRLDVVFRSVDVGDGVAGVRVDEIRRDEAEPQTVYDPGHPDADGEGYVAMPNVNLVEEMVNMITAQRAYEANASAIDVAKNMARAAISIAES
jgi:flagellar basal-body rod protein FlgC